MFSMFVVVSLMYFSICLFLNQLNVNFFKLHRFTIFVVMYFMDFLHMFIPESLFLSRPGWTILMELVIQF